MERANSDKSVAASGLAFFRPVLRQSGAFNKVADCLEGEDLTSGGESVNDARRCLAHGSPGAQPMLKLKRRAAATPSAQPASRII
jgi:hypothetical protein